MEALIHQLLEDSLAVKRAAITAAVADLLAATEMLATAIASGHKILIFGNGGSAADAQHLAAEFVNRFEIERRPLPALALTTDTSVLTSIANDYAFEQIFAKQVQALGNPGDVAWGISTSGNSPNVLAALAAGRHQGLRTLAMVGRGGRLGAEAEVVLRVPTDVTARIQETHITMGHILCALVDRYLFPGGGTR